MNSTLEFNRIRIPTARRRFHNVLGVLTIYMEKPEIPVGKRQKMWAVICSGAIFLLLLVCSADFDILCSGLFSHHVKFYSFMFMHRISTRVVCINIKRP